MIMNDIIKNVEGSEDLSFLEVAFAEEMFSEYMDDEDMALLSSMQGSNSYCESQEFATHLEGQMWRYGTAYHAGSRGGRWKN